MTFRRAVTAGAIAVAIGTVTLVVVHRGGDARTRLDAALRQAAQRPFRARLTGLAYEPPPRITRSATTTSTENEQRLRAVAAEIATSDQNDHRIRGIAALLANDLTSARQRLEAVAAKNPGDASAWSDVAAALSVEANGNTFVLFTALAATDRAIAIDAGHAAARFNRAVILDALSLRQPTEEAYIEYLRVDGTSGWAGEARDRLRILQAETSPTAEWNEQKDRLEQDAIEGKEKFIREVVIAYPQEARTWAEAEFLGEWGSRTLAGNVSAPAILSLSRIIGSALQEMKGESLLADSVAVIDDAMRSNDRSRLSALASAHSAYREARKLYGDRKVARAREKFLDAQSGLDSAGSPMQLVVAYYRANADVDAGQRQSAVVALKDLSDRVPPRYRALLAQISWLRGTIAGMDGLFELALTSYENATAAFMQLGEQQNAIETRARETVLLALLGRTAEAWQQRGELFRMASAAGNDWRLERALYSAALDAIREESWDVASAILLLTTRISTGNPRLRAEGIVWRPLVAKRAGMTQTVQPALAAARLAPAAMSDAGLREEVTNELRLVEALLMGDEHPTRSIDLLRTYVALAERHERTALLPQVLVERARLYRKAGQLDLAEQDLRTAIAAIERSRATMRRDDLRDSFLGKSSAAYDALAELLDDRRDPLGAVATFDRRRARAIINGLGASESAPWQWDGLASLLPKRTAILTYGMFDDRTVVYTLSGRGVSRAAVAVGRAELEALALRHLQAIDAGDRESTRRSGRELYRILIEPAFEFAGASDTLVFIAEKPTESLPFATFVQRDGRLLIESHAITVAPSVEWYVRAASRPEIGPGTSVLSVGGPRLDTLRFPGLPVLRGAEREAHDTAALYPIRTVLVGVEATKARFTAALQHCEVLHIAAHALVDPVDPKNSRFLFAGSADAELTTGELAGMHLGGVRVAVLAGCQTAVSAKGYGDVRSLASGLLAAGIQNVVASLWDLDDEISRNLSTDFHKGLLKGDAPAQALRNAQLRMLSGPDTRLHEPRIWASLQLYGCGR